MPSGPQTRLDAARPQLRFAERKATKRRLEEFSWSSAEGRQVVLGCGYAAVRFADKSTKRKEAR